jgi:hypothetical protein
MLPAWQSLPVIPNVRSSFDAEPTRDFSLIRRFFLD